MSLELRQSLAEEIRAAFKDAVYPGDDQIGVNEMGMDRFVGQKWESIGLDPVKTIQIDLALFYPQGFAYFLPTFLLAAILHPDEIFDLPDFLIHLLSPEEAYSPLSELDAWLKSWREQIVSCLSKAQIEAVKKYFISYRELEPHAPWSFIEEEAIWLDDGIEYWTRLARLD